MNLAAVVFDLDGVLLDSEPFWQNAEREAFARVGVVLDHADLTQTIGMRIDEVIEFWRQRRPWDPTHATPQTLERRIVEHVVRQICHGAEPRPGVVDTLDMLVGSDLRLAVASSSPLTIIEAALTGLGLRSCFECVCSAQHERRGKPAPDVYQTASRRLGIAPDRCLAIEDSIAGLQAAQSAGMACLLVPDARVRADPRAAAAEAVVATLEGLTLQRLASIAAHVGNPRAER